MFAKKIALALHYRFAGEPLSPDGRLLAMLSPNGQYDPVWDEKIVSVTMKEPALRHGSQDLTDQITLRWAYNPDQATVACRLTLQRSLIFYAFTTEDRQSPLLADVREGLERPFIWYMPRIAPDAGPCRPAQNAACEGPGNRNARASTAF